MLDLRQRASLVVFRWWLPADHLALSRRVRLQQLLDHSLSFGIEESESTDADS